MKIVKKIKVPQVHTPIKKEMPGATGLFTLEDIERIQVNANKMRKASKRVNANNVVADYYENYYRDYGQDPRRADVVRNCFNFVWYDYYRLNAVKDIKTVNLCHDKFCVNCQNQISEHRYAKYKSFLDDLTKKYNIYHVVLTLPNCEDDMLKFTLDKMYAKFAHLIRFFQGTKKVRDINFNRYGFVGAVRSLEIAIEQKGMLQNIHPHFHCLFVLSKSFKDEGSHVNRYSFKRSEFKKDRRKIIYFSDFEIFLQKIWFLLLNDVAVTRKNVDGLDLGYSCYAKRVTKDFKEVFKYAMKGMYDSKSSQFMFSENLFRYLKEAIHRRKIIQGYGILNKANFLSDEEEQELHDYYYQRIIALRQIEDPISVGVGIRELVEEMNNPNYSNIRYISKNSVFAKVDDVGDEI